MGSSGNYYLQMKSIVFVALVAGVQSVNIARDPLLTWAPSAKASGHPVDYFVPHFGEDHDIKETKKSTGLAEAQYGHFWVPKDPATDPPRNYFVPNLGEDQDIKDSKTHLAAQEAKHGVWHIDN